MKPIFTTSILFVSLFSIGAFGVDEAKNPTKTETQVETAEPVATDSSAPLTSRDLRAQNHHNVSFVYSLLDTWLPSKWGASYGYQSNPNGTWELEYLSGSYAPLGISELGEFSETRISLLYRSFSQRNTFHFTYGLNYSSLKLGIGDKLLSTITGGVVPGFDVMTVETLGFHWGLGNRWQVTPQFLINVDWFEVHIPLYTLESEAPFLEVNASQEDKEDIRDALDLIESIPTFSLVKFQLGYSF